MGEIDTILIDTHAHLDHERFKDDVDQVIERAKLAQVQSIITVGADLASSRQAVEFARRYPDVIATVGVHPHDADSVSDSVLNEIAILAQDEGVVAIGEIGLDYHYDSLLAMFNAGICNSDKPCKRAGASYSRPCQRSLPRCHEYLEIRTR